MTGAPRLLRAALGAALSAALLAPEAAHACAVCAGQDESVGWVMFQTSLGLSMLPLALSGGGVWFLRRRARQLGAAEAHRDEERERVHRAARSA